MKGRMFTDWAGLTLSTAALCCAGLALGCALHLGLWPLGGLLVAALCLGGLLLGLPTLLLLGQLQRPPGWTPRLGAHALLCALPLALAVLTLGWVGGRPELFLVDLFVMIAASVSVLLYLLALTCLPPRPALVPVPIPVR